MTVLKGAFALASYCQHAISNAYTYIHDSYDQAGCFVWRSMMDDQFLALKTSTDDSNTYRKTTGLYDLGRKHLADWVYETLATKGASGDLCPKPDIKPGLINAAQVTAQTAGPYLARVNWGSPLMMGALCLTAGFAFYAATQTGVAHSAIDTMGTIYGSKPAAPQPTND